MKQKLTVQQVVNAFARPLLSRNPILFGKSPLEVLVDSIQKNDYSRRLSIYPGYKELRDVNKLFSEDKDKLIERLVSESGSNPDEVKEVPSEKRGDFDAEVKKMLSAEYEMKNVLRFSSKELNDSELPISQWELVEPFVDFRPVKSSHK